MPSEPTYDAQGNQLDYFVFSVNEKIGLKNYSSVDVFASVGRFVADDEDARQEVVDLVEAIAARERSVILESLGIEEEVNS